MEGGGEKRGSGDKGGKGRLGGEGYMERRHQVGDSKRVAGDGKERR